MAQVLQDAAGESPDWGTLDMLPDATEGAPDSAAPAGRERHRSFVPGRREALLVAALVLGTLVGALVQAWLHDRREAASEGTAAEVYVVDVALDWEDSTPVTATVSLRNAGPRAVTLLALSTGGGAVVPLPDQLPVRLPAGSVTRVPMSFDTCAPSASWKGGLDAEVRVADGSRRPLALEVVGHREEVRFVQRAVQDACVDSTVSLGS